MVQLQTVQHNIVSTSGGSNSASKSPYRPSFLSEVIFMVNAMQHDPSQFKKMVVMMREGEKGNRKRWQRVGDPTPIVNTHHKATVQTLRLKTKH